ncbi:MAG: DNA polymerase ligase N-terminal domain-containing protein [Chloroflexota bacterium]
MGLAEYKEKRDFEATPEPPGEIKDSGQRRFVVQEHHASRLHYDFRLEMDGVLKSWAVPKGPPEASGVRRLAVQVEDHPVDYIDFAGVIPSGYGAGTVAIWDHGRYELIEQQEGRLAFRLEGQRLQGEYLLLRTQDKNWLLMKRGSAK